jgi:hypothetical protein
MRMFQENISWEKEVRGWRKLYIEGINYLYSWGSAVGIVTGYELDDQGVGV